MANQEQISKDEIGSVVDALSKLEPGVLPFEIFHAVTRLVATPIVEVVPLRRNERNEPEILLLRRDADDPVWPNQLHTPGTVVRGSDKEGCFKDALGRISKELGGATLSHPVFIENILHHSSRGMEASQIYWAEIRNSEPHEGDFYDANNLPDELVQAQLDFISSAVAHYVASTQDS